MAYPTQDKRTRQFKKEGFRRILGLNSAWAAHQAKKCIEGCFYCWMMRRMKA